MKKAIICILLALLLVFAAQAQVLESLREAMSARPGREATASEATASEAKAPSFSEQIGARTVSDTLDVTLYYCHESTSLLGAYRAQLDIRREETVATSIVQMLIDGPDSAHTALTGVFPQGTRIISVSGDGAAAFVTLSRDFLGRPDGAPADWEDLEVWQSEAARRRMLAMQSLVLSLTEDGRYQRVQLYVADGDDEVPMRVPLAYFNPAIGDAGVVLGACSRDESYLLTPARTLNILLSAWQRRDWETVYGLLSAGERGMLPEFAEFEALMQDLDVSLLTYEASQGSVSFNGQRATLVLSAQIRSVDGGDAQLVRESVPLVRVQDNWTMTIDTLLSLMVRD